MEEKKEEWTIEKLLKKLQQQHMHVFGISEVLRRTNRYKEEDCWNIYISKEKAKAGIRD